MEGKKLDKFTADLLKKSLLKAPSEDFTDQVMKKVTSSAKGKFSVNGYIKRAWFFFTLAVIFMPLAFIFSTEIFRTYFTVIHEIISKSFVFVKYTALVVFIVIVFFQLDMLIRHYFSRSRNKIAIG
jgi:hypothetical protein